MAWRPGPIVVHHCPTGPDLAGPDTLQCQCGAPPLPDQPYRAGHAWARCEACGLLFSFCSAEAVLELLDQAERIIG
jgi:hypothetical protein